MSNNDGDPPSSSPHGFPEDIHQAHDKLFKSTFGKPANVRREAATQA